MKNTKTELKFFSITEWKKEELYLREQHKKGWKLCKTTFPGLYRFEKCESLDVIYQLDYNKDGFSHKQEYIKMFNDCGWEYVQDFVGYFYFRKPVLEMEGEEEIFCDDESRAEMMKRVFMGRITPLFGIFFLIIIPNIYIQGSFNSLENHILFIGFIVLLILYIFLFIHFGLWFWKYWKNSRK